MYIQTVDIPSIPDRSVAMGTTYATVLSTRIVVSNDILFFSCLLISRPYKYMQNLRVNLNVN